MLEKIKRALILNFFSVLPSLRFSVCKVRFLNLLKGFNIEKGVVLASSIKFLGGGEVRIGKDSFIGHYSKVIFGDSQIDIGERVDISSNVLLITGSHKLGNPSLRSAGRGISNSIIIEDGVWIGANVTILGGVKIGSGAVIAAGTTVYKSVDKNTIVSNSSMKVIKTWSEEDSRWV